MFNFYLNNFNVIRVIVHGGKPHLDDYLVVGLARALWPDVEVARRDPTAEELEDPSVLVADVGGRYEPEKMNFDHHQDGGFPAAVVLVTEYLLGREFVAWVKENKPAWLSHDWLTQVSVRDTQGSRKAEEMGIPDPAGILTGAALRGFERLEPWALELVTAFWRDQLESFQKSQIEIRPDDIPVIEAGPRRVADLTAVPDGFNPFEWSRLVERRLEWPDHDPALIVLPNDRGPGLKIIRRNDAPGVDLSVLADTPGVSFAHPRGFVAVVEVGDFEEALEVLRKIL